MLNNGYTEIDHGGDLYTTEIDRNYKSVLLLLLENYFTSMQLNLTSHFTDPYSDPYSERGKIIQGH